jgi:hypothetical protein
MVIVSFHSCLMVVVRRYVSSKGQVRMSERFVSQDLSMLPLVHHHSLYSNPCSILTPRYDKPRRGGRGNRDSVN